ncbi:hypothetical protein [Bacillus subtilis]|nr:hypothetical protein [Bacillus subtilis]KIN30245.1 hypothetical protein B4069_1206 [Bacillus subtilis]KIN43639.1 hypothetical protein B4072_1172 [Bacillus subtilis]
MKKETNGTSIKTLKVAEFIRSITVWLFQQTKTGNSATRNNNEK